MLTDPGPDRFRTATVWSGETWGFGLPHRSLQDTRYSKYFPWVTIMVYVFRLFLQVSYKIVLTILMPADHL